MKKSINQISQIVANKITPDNYRQIAREIWWILTKQRQYGKIEQLIEEIDEKYCASQGCTKLKVISPKELDDEHKDQVQVKLEKIYKGPVNIDFAVDEKILGGLKIISKDNIYDYSYSAKLKQLKQKMVGNNE
ncbi:MAG: F0F1 ATP synthase subunit delta [candidate division WS2 bacterium ADurb.Bin280]|uniref:F0F1 ATP synthase subunit delta n=1 Tax=candidate division WS2 bacterium ADurb.Bin280 TaxID=1852829 RepID=A0A1V5SBY5_9BACT|nr:MAG: F0F1 ATP synthase subunit delta [candidate division WS2 bacterium ADurb.Bin280]